MLRKRGNQDFTLCRLGDWGCVGLVPITNLPLTPLYLETSMHSYGLEFPLGIVVFVPVGLSYKGLLSWSTEGGTDRRNLVC